MTKNKQKTRSGVSKRFKITKTGKVMRRSQNMRHLRRNKSKRTLRKYRTPQQVTGKFARKIKRMLGLA
ncbi:MAG: 50S ribosomal protein L35 [Candidatus Pacebacteria bacterium CG10_big_fil_rev_8_21_14_0_10_42_12]|nr:50S ribosomal protein L35 [Candidatus Paceibacterota bacterium]PIR62676.1 MAG: 50S ribosomal protein L35 [Candidatus Pacebacteria bacterium CG10_big_fil_rev_8_21_14_0_10_42_12]